MNFKLAKLCALSDNLNIRERGLMLILCNYANKENCCWPSYKTLSSQLDLSERNLRRIIKNLREKGILIIKDTDELGRLMKTNLYKINIENLFLDKEIFDNLMTKNSWYTEANIDLVPDIFDHPMVDRDVLTPDKSVQGGKDKSVQDPRTNLSSKVNINKTNTNEVNKINKINKINKNNKKTLTSVEKTKRTKIIQKKFEEFWELYPRKKKKEPSLKKFHSKCNWDEKIADEIIEGLKKQLPFLLKQKKKDIHFIPHPSTWLNQERWKDEVYDQENETEDWRL
ncbi:MAG: helix-turn-helix domain-containing protein [Candidatus Thorarchaeota archaeon]